MGILRVNNKFNFEKKIRSFCKAPQYYLEEIESDTAFIVLLDSDGAPKYPVLLYEHEDSVQFCITLGLELEGIEDISESLSTLLLRLNGESNTGFWSLNLSEDDDTDDEIEDDEAGDYELADDDMDNKNVIPMYFYNYIVPKVLLNQNRFDDAIADLAGNYEFFYSLFDGFEPEFDEDDEDLDAAYPEEDSGKHRHEH